MARRRVVIVGGGFGGLAAAAHLGGADVDVTLVDRQNHHLFQPLIYQVAAGALSEGDCAAPIRRELRRHANIEVLMAEAGELDATAQTLALDSGERLAYDSLVVACGGATSYFGHDAWADRTFALKSLEDAMALREQVYGAYERAERVADPAERERLLTFVVVGGGPTGVEIAGQLAVIARRVLEGDFHRIEPASARVIVLDAGDRILASFHPSMSGRARRGLADLGVDVRTGARVQDIDDRGVVYDAGDGPTRVDADTVVWAAGVRAAGIADEVVRATGAPADRGGRVQVSADLAVPGHPEISVIGDAAALSVGGQPVPGLATAAIQQGRHVAAGIRAGAPGAVAPFRYFDKGALAVIGRGRAICEVRGVRFSGPPAMAMYLGVHLFYLAGVFGRRARVLNAWLTAGFGARGERVLTHRLPAGGATTMP